MKVHVATSRPIGDKCIAWALENLADLRVKAGTGFDFTDRPDEADVWVSVMYHALVSEEFIARRRCYNFHPGLLPQYRGAGAFSWAIINGEKRCGVTLHELDVDIDTGPVIDRAQFAVEAWDTAETLFAKGMDAMFALFQKWFADVVRGRVVAVPQEGGRCYYRKDLEKARDLTRWVRAFAFEGKPTAFYVDRTGKRVELKW